MNLAQPMIEELGYESAATRRMLERVPEDKFDWAPHPKSMSLIKLASHMADMPGWAPLILAGEEFVIPEEYKPVLYPSAKALVETFDANVANAEKHLRNATDDQLLHTWRLLAGGQVVFSLPRIAVLRSMVMSHAIHHRGQLSVYLRILGVPVPSSYGPTADEQ